MECAHTANRVGDAFDLRFSDRVGDLRHAGVVEHLAIRADQPCEALASEFSGRWTSVRRWHRVVSRREIATPDMDVADQRESLRGQADTLAADHHVTRDRFGRRSKRSRVDEFARRKPLGIGAATRDHCSVDNRNHIRRGRADVDEHSVVISVGDECHRRGPIRRRD